MYPAVLPYEISAAPLQNFNGFGYLAGDRLTGTS
jgi:hypothetical protein